MDYSSPGSSVHGIIPARIVAWVVIFFSRGSSWPRDGTCISCTSCFAVGFFYPLRPQEAPLCHVLLFSGSAVSNSLQPHGLQHARLPYPSPTPRACSNSCPVSQWCHRTISSSVICFSSCLQSLPASGSFLVSWLFTSDGQSIGVSASASVLPMNIQDWFPFGLTGLILQSKGLKSLLQHHSSKTSILWSPNAKSWLTLKL